MDSEKLVRRSLPSALQMLDHNSEELLWSPGLFLGEEVWSSELSTKLALQR